jgi:hypothetical protein
MSTFASRLATAYKRGQDDARDDQVYQTRYCESDPDVQLAYGRGYERGIKEKKSIEDDLRDVA